MITSVLWFCGSKSGMGGVIYTPRNSIARSGLILLSNYMPREGAMYSSNRYIDQLTVLIATNWRCDIYTKESVTRLCETYADEHVELSFI